MSWREKRLITLLSVILAVLCAAVLIVLSMRYREARAAREDETVAAAELAQSAQSDYVALSYHNGSAYLAFALNEDGAWYWENEPSFPLDDTDIRSILAVLKNLKPQQTLDLPEDLSEYGLDTPHVRLTATAPDGAVLSIQMGNTTTDGESYYAIINNDSQQMHIIPNSLHEALQTPIYQMCRLPTLPSLREESLHYILLQGPVTEQTDETGELTESRPITVLSATRDEGGNAVSWRSGGANVTDSPLLRSLLKDLAVLKVAECVDYRPSEEAAAFCGFDEPSTLTVQYETAAGTEESFIMNIGTQNMDGSGRYVRLGEEDAIYLVTLDLLDPMMHIAYLGLEDAA